MDILQVGLRGDIHIGRNGSFPTTPGISIGNNEPQTLKWPSRSKQQQIVAKIASRRLRSRSSRISPQAVSCTVSARQLMSNCINSLEKYICATMRSFKAGNSGNVISRYAEEAGDLQGPENAYRGSQDESARAEPELEDFPDEAIPTSTGYLPINAESKSRLFYVYYEATNNSKRLSETPIVLWLNGGPGCSSLIGCFYELGPWRLNEKMKLSRNEGTWNRRHAIAVLSLLKRTLVSGRLSLLTTVVVNPGAGCCSSTNRSASASVSRRLLPRFRPTNTRSRLISFTRSRAGCRRTLPS
jgi:hypothetical protein